MVQFLLIVDIVEGCPSALINEHYTVQPYGRVEAQSRFLDFGTSLREMKRLWHDTDQL
jgi:hypothetical protein